jgi:nucleotide-binding universal stress UspA family protein
MKVLVATDGSDAAIEASRRAFALLRPGAEMLLVAVVPDYENPEEMAGGFEGPVASDKQAEREFEEGERAGADALSRTAAALAGAAEAEGRTRAAVEPDVEVRLVSGGDEPGPAIVAVAEETKADLIVIGAHAKGFVRRLLTRSVSDHVVHHAPCPVLVIRSDHP